MIYRDFQGIKLSALGMGLMRLPTVDGDYSKIDEAQTEKMFAYAMENGVNYYDTAWAYHNGESERVAGKFLSQFQRESYHLANKFPGYDLTSFSKVAEIFEKQLEKCRVDYFDFYLFHNVDDTNIVHYLRNDEYGHFTYLVDQKKKGRIKHLGVSFHSNPANMRRFLDAYGSEIEFCQIQFNWLDWTLQNAKEKLDLLREFRLPVWVMEPLRGGRLARLSDEEAKSLRDARPDETIPAWSFRFTQSIPEIGVTLSGMSSLEQVRQNIETFEADRPLNSDEMKTLLALADHMKSGIPCTACRYCVSHCPVGLDIPTLLTLCNERRLSGNEYYINSQMKLIPEEKRPDQCLACRSCEAVCPQGIKISEEFAKFSKGPAK